MKILKKQRILIVTLALLLFLQQIVYADIFFSGTGGVATDLSIGNAPSTTELKISAFYMAQIQLGEKFLLNSGISFQAENIFDDTLSENVFELFSLDEFSLLYRFSIERTIGQIALFAGEYESAGNDTFLRRHFGAQGVNSNLLENQIEQKAASIFPISGLGFALGARFSQPLEAAFYAYYNEKFEKKHVNIDLRIAGITDSFLFDFVFGVSLPLDTTDAFGAEVEAIIRRADLHAGITMILGRNTNTNIFMQFGIARIQLKPDPKQVVASLEDLYVFIEPRFATEKMNVAFSIFSIPQDTSDIIQYIDNSVGVNLSMETIRIDMGKNHGVVGGFITASIPNSASTDFDMKNLSIQIAPYVEVNIGKHIINASLQIRPLKYENFSGMITLSASYKIKS